MQIPLSRPDITHKEIDAVVEVMQSGTLSIGPRLVQFENACAAIAGRRHAVGVSSGTAGLHLCMLAAGIRPGDEIITTPFSFVASANCILYVGAKPVFVDIDTRTLNLDPEKVKAAITPKTRAIIPVEVFGHPGGMDELEQIARQNEIIFIEDCCEAFGGMCGERHIGSYGRAGVFAFYPNKQITTGEGGMIVTDDDQFADTCRALRNQGRSGMAWLSHEKLGYNYRLSEIQAAIGLVQTQRLEQILDKRRRVAAVYIDRLMTSPHLLVPTLEGEDDSGMSWFVFVVRLNDLFSPSDRDVIITRMREQGIGCSNYFPPIHLQPYMREMFGYQPGAFPVCEYVSSRTLALPFFSDMTGVQIRHVCDTLEKIIDDLLKAEQRRM